MMKYFTDPIAEVIWNIKYRYQRDGKIIDQTIEDTWWRVAQAVASIESSTQKKVWQQKFVDILTDFRFLPGGRILAGAGTHRKVTLFNCFVMNIAEDSIAGIFNGLKEGALTLQEGGGVGYDFSILRPKGQVTLHSGSTASGPVSFMRVWDSMSATMESSGARRGAMMGTLRCDHPDIEEFIHAKSDPTQLRHFNVSVIVTDAFMQAVQNNAEWALVFPFGEREIQTGEIVQRRWSNSHIPVPCRVFCYISARELWQKIIKAAYDYAEPGVMFEDTINKMNPLWYREWISTTNPCGEIPLPAYGACNLGSINLTRFITNPFSSSATIDWKGIETTTEIATRFLDNVIEVSKYPLKSQQRESMLTRRIGLGFTGLADALVMLGIRYGSNESLQLTERITKTIAYTTWHTSVALAKEKGDFPLLDKKLYLKSAFVDKLPEEIRHDIKRQGIRNSHHNAIAPTGTISLLANNISSGLEPIFNPYYERQVRAADGNILIFKVSDYAVHLWQKCNPEAEQLPPGWIDAQKLMPEEHIQMQAVVQKYIDHAISKTINLPEKFLFTKLNEVYTKAHQMGLKGCTIFRPNPITGSVMSTEEMERCCRI